jgi:hypothetical protein
LNNFGGSVDQVGGEGGDSNDLARISRTYISTRDSIQTSQHTGSKSNYISSTSTGRDTTRSTYQTPESNLYQSLSNDYRYPDSNAGASTNYAARSEYTAETGSSLMRNSIGQQSSVIYRQNSLRDQERTDYENNYH